jgi:hypothetical protein
MKWRNGLVNPRKLGSGAGHDANSPVVYLPGDLLAIIEVLAISIKPALSLCNRIATCRDIGMLANDEGIEVTAMGEHHEDH